MENLIKELYQLIEKAKKEGFNVMLDIKNKDNCFDIKLHIDNIPD